MSEADAKALWDREYDGGRWAYLHKLQEAARYGVVSAYIHHHLRPGAGATVLDLGCGEAILDAHLDRGRVARYVGVDISPVALAKVRPEPERMELIAGAIDSYAPAPDARYEAIVFNEVLHFAEDPIGVVTRFRSHLAEGGVMIISMHQSPRENTGLRVLRDLWAALERAPWEILDETTLINVGKSLTWRLRVLR